MKLFGLAKILSFALSIIKDLLYDPLKLDECDRCGRGVKTRYPVRITKTLTELICGTCYRIRWSQD